MCRSPVQVKRISDYARADFGAINHELGTFLSDYLRNFSERSVEDNWMLFKEKVAFLTNRYVPVRTVRNYTRSPWFNQTLRRLSNRKKRMFRAAKLFEFSNAEHRWAAYYSAAGVHKAPIAEAKLSCF